MMIGYGDEASLFGDAGKLFGENLVGDANLFKHSFGKLRTIMLHEFLVHCIDFMYFEEAVNTAGYKAPECSFEPQSVLQVGFRNYVLLFFHIAYGQQCGT